MSRSSEQPSVPVNTEGKKDEDEEDYGPGCGWHFCFSGSCVRHSRTAKWLLFWMCAAVAVQGMIVNGFVNVNITTIEKRFNLMSRTSGIISGSYDVASLLVSVPVSYLGSRPGVSKPRWLGVGLIIVGLGSYLFMLPHFLVPPHGVRLDNTTLNSSAGDLCIQQTASTTACESGADGSGLQNFVYFFIFGQYLMGFGATPIYTIGLAFIDESVTPTQSAFYLGIFHMMALVGPALGFGVGGQVLNVYIDAPTVDPATLGLTPSHDGWLGAWWLGFVVSGTLALVIAVPMLMIPAHIPRKDVTSSPGQKSPTDEDESSKDKEEASETDVPVAGGAKAFQHFDGLLEASKSLLCNTTFLFTSIARSCGAFVSGGLGTFFPKVMETQFSVPASQAATSVGIVVIVGGAVGILLGGWIIKRFKMPTKTVLKMCFFVSLSCILSDMVFFLRCPNMNFAGVNVQYDSFNSPVQPNISYTCNADCSCSDVPFNPVCGANNVIYFSPCHAGCTQSTKHNDQEIFSKCRCVEALPKLLELPGTESLGLRADEAIKNSCPSDCNLFILFLAFSFGFMFVSFLMVMPIVNATLRSVEPENRSLAMGLQAISFRLFGSIPGPLVYGMVIDRACTLWRDSCGSPGACAVYDNYALGRYLFGMSFAGKVLSVTSTFFAWRTFGRRLFGNQEKRSNVDTGSEPAGVRSRSDVSGSVMTIDTIVGSRNSLNEPSVQDTHM